MSVVLSFTFVWLLSRFIFLNENRRMSLEVSLLKLLVELGLIYFLFSGGGGTIVFYGVVALDFLVILLGEYGERKEPNGKLDIKWRAITGLGLIGGLSLVSIYPGLNLGNRIEFRGNAGAFFSREVLGYGCGILLCLKEGNYITRWICGMLKLGLKIKRSSNTENGRFIGAFERVLYFAFLLIGAETAVTFIAAVKGLARFKHMEEDEAFAEYVIIGTFLSILITVIIFSLSKQWIAG